MTDSMNDLADRLRSAVHAETGDVSPAGGSLDTIRARVRTARRRRRAVLAGAGVAALVAVAVVMPGGGDDTKVTTADRDRTTTTTAPEQPSSTTTAPTSPPATDLDQAIWPDPASSSRYADPVDAARSFVDGFLGDVAGTESAFRPSGPGAGEIDIRSRDEDGQTSTRVAATLSLRQLDGEHWFVTAATSESVRVDSPEPLAAVSSPVHVTGQARGYEGTVEVSVRERTAAADRLGAEVTIAGSADSLEPFSVDVPYRGDSSSIGVVVAGTDSGAPGALPPFAALPVRLSPAEASTESPGPSDQSIPGPAAAFRSQPLWPFSTQAQADEWLASSREGGHQPWHADAVQTALGFTTGYLGFTEIDQVTSTDIRADEAWIGVGYESGPGNLSTSAVIHLVRFGPDPEAPWEVVGTRDSVLTLDIPRYGSAVSAPVTVGGTITGVDESLRVQVRQPSSSAPIGERCCLPAGGEGTPWETSVSFAGATDPALTIVVSSGGHVQGVEIFAVTGVHL